MKFYLNRTKNVRGISPRPFYSVRNPVRALSKNAMSFLIKQVILDAHTWAPESRFRELKVKAHEVRAVATSLAFIKNASMQDILNTATWRSSTVFVNYYLRHLSFAYGDVNALGPLVAASLATRI